MPYCMFLLPNYKQMTMVIRGCKMAFIIIHEYKCVCVCIQTWLPLCVCVSAALNGGPQCRLSILRNGNVHVTFSENFPVDFKIV